MPAASPVRLPRAQRRAQLLDLADELFMAEGFLQVSMDELAERAGVTKPVIYDHFGSKDGLVRAMLERHAAALASAVAEAVAAAEGAEARFRAGGRAFFAWVAERGPAVTVVLDGVAGGAEVGDELRVLRRNQVAQTAGLLAETLRLAGVPLDAAGEAELVPVAQMLAAAYEALALWWQREAPGLSVDEVNERYFQLMWPGLRAGLGALAES